VPEFKVECRKATSSEIFEHSEFNGQGQGLKIQGHEQNITCVSSYPEDDEFSRARSSSAGKYHYCFFTFLNFINVAFYVL